MAKKVKSGRFRHGKADEVREVRHGGQSKVLRYKVKPVVESKYGVFTCVRCGGPKKATSPAELCYSCRHPKAEARQEGGQRRGKKRKKSAKAREARSRRRRWRQLLNLRDATSPVAEQSSVDEILEELGVA